MTQSDLKTILAEILKRENGKTIHVRMEMPFTWGVTLSGEVDSRDIAVSDEMAFAQYAEEYRESHPDEKVNIIDFTLKKNGTFSEHARFDEEFQKEQEEI